MDAYHSLYNVIEQIHPDERAFVLYCGTEEECEIYLQGYEQGYEQCRKANASVKVWIEEDIEDEEDAT